MIWQCIIVTSLPAKGSKQVMVLYGTSDLVLYGTLQMNFIFRPL